jgi:hypothetical protein
MYEPKFIFAFDPEMGETDFNYMKYTSAFGTVQPKV